MGLYWSVPVDWIKSTAESMGTYEIEVSQSKAASEASHYPPEDAEEEDMEDFFDACYDYDEEEPSEFDISEAVRDFKSAFESTIYQLCPVRTGYLRSSCRCEVSDELIECFADAEYAQYVEYGTYKMEPQPYFEPAIRAGLGAFIARSNSLVEEYKKDVEDIAEEAIEEVLYNAADLASLVFILIIGVLISLILAFIQELFAPMWEDFHDAIASMILQSTEIIIE